MARGPIPASGAAVIGRVIATGRPQFGVNWTDISPGGSASSLRRRPPDPAGPGCGSSIGPGRPARDPFTALDDSFLLALGHQVGAALENADLYSRLETRTVELARLPPG